MRFVCKAVYRIDPFLFDPFVGKQNLPEPLFRETCPAPHLRFHYFGCLQPDQKDVAKDIAAGVYSHWDASSNAPPTQAPT